MNSDSDVIVTFVGFNKTTVSELAGETVATLMNVKVDPRYEVWYNVTNTTIAWEIITK